MATFVGLLDGDGDAHVGGVGLPEECGEVGAGGVEIEAVVAGGVGDDAFGQAGAFFGGGALEEAVEVDLNSTMTWLLAGTAAGPSMTNLPISRLPEGRSSSP